MNVFNNRNLTKSISKPFFRFLKKKDDTEVDATKSILEFDNAQKHCMKLVKDFDFFSYVIGKAYPKQLRPYYFGYHAFFIEIRKARFASRESSVSQMRLQFWDEALSDAIHGKTPNEPVSVVLKETFLKTAVKPDLLKRMIAFQFFDLDRNGELDSIADLEIYAENVRSLLLFCNLNLLKIRKDDAYLAASLVGRGVGIVDILRKTPSLVRMDVNLLPNDLMAKHSINQLEISNRYGQMKEEYFDAVLEVAGRAKRLIEEARMMETIKEPENLCLLNAVDSYDYLMELEQYNFNPFEENLQKVQPFNMSRKIIEIGKKGKF